MKTFITKYTKRQATRKTTTKNPMTTSKFDYEKVKITSKPGQCIDKYKLVTKDK